MAAVYKRTVTAYRCERCEHEWIPRRWQDKKAPLPTVCPKCKSPYWNKPRKQPKAKPKARVEESNGQ